MARNGSPLKAKIPAVVNADKAVAQWKSLRREHGDDRVATDLGFIPGDVASGMVHSDGSFDAAFAQADVSEQATAQILGMTGVVEAAESGVLAADVSKWGAIAVWLLAWVQSMMSTVGSSEEGFIDQMLGWIYGNLQKKAGEGTRLAVVRAHVDESRPCWQHSDRDNVVLRGECHEPHEDYTLVPYNGPAEMVDGIVYSALVEMGRAAANDPWLDPEHAQFRAVQIIASRRWKDMKIRAIQSQRGESLDVLLELGTHLTTPMFRFNRDDQAITSATDCEVRNRDGQVVRMIPAIAEVTEVPCAPETLRTKGIEYHESHWKGDNRAAETRALADVHRQEIVAMLLDGVHRGLILHDKRTGKPTKDAELVARTACVLLFLRSQSSLQAVNWHLVKEGEDKKYRNLQPSEIAQEVAALTGYSVTKYIVSKALDVLHSAEDAYWHFVHTDSGEEILLSCHVCNAEHHENREIVADRRRLAREAVALWETKVKASA